MIHCLNMMSLENAGSIWTQLVPRSRGRRVDTAYWWGSTGPSLLLQRDMTQENQAKIDYNKTNISKRTTGTD